MLYRVKNQVSRNHLRVRQLQHEIVFVVDSASRVYFVVETDARSVVVSSRGASFGVSRDVVVATASAAAPVDYCNRAGCIDARAAAASAADVRR